MSDPRVPTRDEIVRVIQRKPVGKRPRQFALALLVLGGAAFLYGAFTGNQRAWTAYHMNWLFFTIIASAGVTMAAVARLTTARWSRSVMRIVEGFVAFLPVAFVLLLVTIFFAKDKVYPWWNAVGTAGLIPEKNTYLNHGFFWARSLIIFGAITLFSLYYVWLSVRLDVGVTPEDGASWAAGLRAKMRATFGDERRELHTTHSIQGKLAVILVLLFGMGWVVLSWDHSMSLDPHFFSTMYGWQVFMGGSELKVVVHIFTVLDDSRGNAGGLHQFHYLMGRPLARPGLNIPVQFLDMAEAGFHGCELGVTDPVRLTQNRTEAPPLTLVESGDHTPSVSSFASVAVVGSELRMAVAYRPLGAMVNEVVEVHKAKQGNSRVSLTNLDGLPFPRSATMVESR